MARFAIPEERASSWTHLQELLYEGSYNPQLNRFRSRFAFRGTGACDNGLDTALQRLTKQCTELEAHMLRNFRKFASSHDVPTDSAWNWLALAQHHGLPTRLLDWTFSPFVAMHFATENVDRVDCDALIWCVNYVESNRRLPEPLRRVLEEEGSDVFTAEMLSTVAPTLPDFDALSDEPFAVFFDPPSFNDRIVSQSALFSLMSDPSLSLEEHLAAESGLLKRIIVPKELKWEVRDKLDQANINERLLFPGLDGLSRWLKRYYGPRRSA